MLSQIVGALVGALGMLWSDLAVGTVIIAAILSFVAAVVLTVGRHADPAHDDQVERTHLSG